MAQPSDSPLSNIMQVVITNPGANVALEAFKEATGKDKDYNNWNFPDPTTTDAPVTHTLLTCIIGQ